VVHTPAAYRVGDKVRHARIGVGEVVAAEGPRVVIRFGTEEKTFLLERAPLTPVITDVFMASEKVAQAIGEWNGQRVVERVRESEHATEADIIAFAEAFLSGGYREREPGASFARIFEQILRKGGDVIQQQMELVQSERKRKQEELAERLKNTPLDPEQILASFFDDDLDDESTASRKLYSTQKEKGREKGYAVWNLQKKTKVIMAQVQEILGEYRAELPLTGRQIFYRLVGKYGYPKDEKAYGRLTNYLVRARRSRTIPFESIRDDGASVMEGKFYTGEEDFYRHIHDEAKGYERDKLAGQKRDIRVYVESAGMMPQLERLTRRYSVPVYSCSGFDSLTAKYDLADEVAKASTYRGRQTVILHLGDMDPSGETIFDAISEDVHSFLEVDVPHKRPEDVAIFERVALTPALVEEYDLPTDPAKESSHSAGWGPRRACQLEALAPDVLARILTRAIESYMDLSVLEADREAEVEERRKIAKALPAGTAS